MSASIFGKKGSVVTYRRDELESLLMASRQSPRRRMIQQIQRSEQDPVQRLLNAMQLGTYVRPHRHPLAGASETVVLLQGKLGVVIFSDDGNIVESILLKRGAVLDIESGVWHSMVCLAPDTVIAEFKMGPYDVTTDKEFAPWSEDEGGGLVAEMESLFGGGE